MTVPSLLDELEPCPFCGRGKPFDQWPCEWLDGSGANVIRCAWCHGAAPANVWNRRTHHATNADMAKRMEMAERDARGEREETWEIWECGMCVAGADDLGDAQHYLTMYGQDGPVKLVRVISYRETVTPDAIDAATQEGEE